MALNEFGNAIGPLYACIILVWFSCGTGLASLEVLADLSYRNQNEYHSAGAGPHFCGISYITIRKCYYGDIADNVLFYSKEI